jgi:hypothetical protein
MIGDELGREHETVTIEENLEVNVRLFSLVILIYKHHIEVLFAVEQLVLEVRQVPGRVLKLHVVQGQAEGAAVNQREDVVIVQC